MMSALLIDSICLGAGQGGREHYCFKMHKGQNYNAVIVLAIFFCNTDFLPTIFCLQLLPKPFVLNPVFNSKLQLTCNVSTCMSSDV